MNKIIALVASILVCIAASAQTGFDIPFEIQPTTAEFEHFIVVDGNGDGVKWKYDAQNGGSLTYAYSSRYAAYDWVFIPVNAAEASTAYNLSFKYRTAGDYPENFKICYGNAPTEAAMTTELWKKENYKDKNFADETLQFTAAGANFKYIGIKAYSTADQYGIYFQCISLSAVNERLPQAPVIASGAIEGLIFNADITMPSATVTGASIAEPLGLEIAVDGEACRYIDNLQAGQNVAVSETLAKGTHEITFRAYVLTDGEKEYSKAVSQTVKAVSLDPYSLPFSYEFNAEQLDEECTVVDANNDGISWGYSTKKNTAYYYYNDYADADDWLVLPAIDFGDNNGSFDLSIWACVESYNYPESFEILVGDSDDVSTMTTIMVCNDISNTAFEEFKTTFTVATPGVKYIAIHATSKKGMFSCYVKDLAISRAANMTPKAPEIKNVAMNGLEGCFTIEMPSKTVDDIALEGTLSLITSVDGTEYSTISAEAGTEVVVPITFTLGSHAVTFFAVSEEWQGTQTLYTLIARHPDDYTYGLPFEMLPTQGEFETFTILDANNDGNTWTYFQGTNAAMECKTDGSNASDDWVFLPKFKIEDITRIYSVAVQARAYLESYPETFDVCIGKEAAPEAMTAVISREQMTKYIYDDALVADWIASEPGNYLIGIHRKSDGNAHTLRVRNIKVSDSGRSILAPAEATDYTSTPEPTGLLKATVNFTMPTVSVDGSTLAADYKMSATLTSRTGASSSVEGYPGDRLTLTVAAPDGYSILSLTTFSETYGEGRTVEIPVYCGIDIPSIPTVNITVAEDNLSAFITWADPTLGENGGAVNPSALTHAIYEPIAGGLYWNKIADVPAGQSSYTLNAELLQNVCYVGVAAANDRGESQIGVNYAVLGTPYTLPMAADFKGGEFGYEPVVIETPDERYIDQWYLDYPSLLISPILTQADGQALMCIRAEETDGTVGRVMLPKFTTTDSRSVKISLTIFDGPIAPKTSVYITGVQGQSKIGEFIPSEAYGWKDITFELPEDCYNRGWLYLTLEPEFSSAPQLFALRSYNIRSTYAKELDLALYAPEEIIVGDENEIVVKVKNLAETSALLPAIECTISAESFAATLATEMPESIAAGEQIALIYKFTPVTEMLGTCTVKAEFSNYTDEVADNNSDTAECDITTGAYLIVTDLTTSETDDHKVKLEWSMPVNDKCESTAAGFHIYREGAKIVDNHGRTEYIDESGANGNSYHVSAITVSGEEHPLSNKVTATIQSGLASPTQLTAVYAVEGGIRVAGFEGKNVEIFTPEGLRVQSLYNISDNETINLSAGIYIIAVGDKAFKLRIY